MNRIASFMLIGVTISLSDTYAKDRPKEIVVYTAIGPANWDNDLFDSPDRRPKIARRVRKMEPLLQ